MTQHLGNVFDYKLEPEGYPSLEEEGTTIHTGAYHIGLMEDVHVGVWEAHLGLIGGEAADEIFIILEGRAEVTFDETGETLLIGPGDVVRLYAGKRNTWRTLEPIRKISVWSDKKPS